MEHRAPFSQASSILSCHSFTRHSTHIPQGKAMQTSSNSQGKKHPKAVTCNVLGHEASLTALEEPCREREREREQCYKNIINHDGKTHQRWHALKPSASWSAACHHGTKETGCVNPIVVLDSLQSRSAQEEDPNTSTQLTNN